MEFEKFNCFFIDFLRLLDNESYFDRDWKRVYTTDYSYILENHFYILNASGYYFKPFLSRIFCVNSSVKVLPPQYEGPSTHISHIIALHVHYLQKERNSFRS